MTVAPSALTVKDEKTIVQTVRKRKLPGDPKEWDRWADSNHWKDESIDEYFDRLYDVCRYQMGIAVATHTSKSPVITPSATRVLIVDALYVFYRKMSTAQQQAHKTQYLVLAQPPYSTVDERNACEEAWSKLYPFDIVSPHIRYQK